MHDPKLIRDAGDYLEQRWADETLSRLPGYALFWATYIGNDGRSNYLPMRGPDGETLTLRTNLWEYLYTLFESFALCWHLENRFNKLQAISNPDDYADNLNDWIAFYAHLGRIHDMAEKAADKFKGENLYEPFDLFYEQRHTVLHYPKVPMAFVQNVLTAPHIGDAPKHWQKNMRWKDIKAEDFDFLGIVVTTTLRELEKVANKFFYQIATLAKEQKHFTPVVWPDPRARPDSNIRFNFPKVDPFARVAAMGSEPPNPSGTGTMPMPPPSGSRGDLGVPPER